MCHNPKAAFDGKHSALYLFIFHVYVPWRSDFAFAFMLQVWGLFAPKFVFDVVGLILMDILICLASLYYLVSFDNDSL